MNDALAEYVAAVGRERMLRDAAFVLPSESIGEFEVEPMTLRHLVSLRLIKSPILAGKEAPTPADAATFLWTVGAREVPQRIKRYCTPRAPLVHLPFLMRRYERKAAERALLFAELLRQIGIYLDEAMQDWPAGKGEEGPSYYSDCAALCHEMGIAYGWSAEQTMNTPLKVIFQLVKIIRAEQKAKMGKAPVFFNPSDRLKANLPN